MAYDNPDGLIAAAVIVQILVIAMIVSRFVSHKIRNLKYHTSDYLIIVAGVLSTALAIEQIYCKYLEVRQGRRQQKGLFKHAGNQKFSLLRGGCQKAPHAR